MMKLPPHKGLLTRGTEYLIALSTVLLLAILLLIFIDVVGRNAIHKGVRGASELAHIAMLLMVTAALPYVEHTADHLGIDFLVEKISAGVHRAVQILVAVLELAFASALVWRVVIYVRNELTTGRHTEVYHVPQWLLYSFVVAMIAAVFIVIIRRVAALVTTPLPASPPATTAENSGEEG